MSAKTPRTAASRKKRTGRRRQEQKTPTKTGKSTSAPALAVRILDYEAYSASIVEIPLPATVRTYQQSNARYAQ